MARWSLAHRRLVVWLCLLVCLAAGALAFPAKVDPSLLALLPKGDPAAEALRDLDEASQGMSLLTIAASGDDPVALEAFLDDLTTDLGRLDEVSFAVHEVDPALAQRVGMLQLRAADVRELTGRLRGALALGPALNPMVTQRLMDLGPVAERIANAPRSGSLLGGGDGRGRILVRPAGSSHDTAFSDRLMDRVYASVDAALAQHPGVRLEWVGGPYRHNAEDRRGIERDLVWTSVASFVLVLGVLAIGFRSLKTTALLTIPLAVSSLLGLGLTPLLYGSLNTYTSFGTAILAGLGIDFGIHLLSRYRELRRDGRDRDDALAMAWDRVGPPCTTAALTTAAGFVSLAAASFRGFSQLGVVLAMGLLISLVLMLVLLPALLPWLDDSERHARRARRVSKRVSRSTYRLAPVGLIVAVFVTGVVGAVQLPRLDWQFDLSVLRRGGLAYEELDDTERALARDSYSPVVVTFPSREALAQGQQRVEAELEADSLAHVGRAVSLESVLPLDQADRLTALAELQVLLDDPDMRYVPAPLTARLQQLRDATLTPLSEAELPRPLLDLVGARGGEHHLLLFPKGNMWDLREAAALSDEVARLFPNRPTAGEYLALGSLHRTLRRDLPLVAALAFLFVAALTALDLRKAGPVAAALGTLLAGLAWGGAAVRWFGIELSILNVVGLPILLGISVDVVIHLLHRLAEEGPGGLRRALSTTGVAVAMSGVTTILGFASLVLAGNRGVQGLGLLVSIGLTAGSLVAVLLLPLAWAAGWRIAGQAPGARRER